MSHNYSERGPNMADSTTTGLQHLLIADMGPEKPRGVEFGLLRSRVDGVTLRVKTLPGTNWACVRGEDLFALREFLAEIPEEAFVRPADPSAWTDADIILSGNRGEYVWFRENGRWNRNGAHGRQMISDEIMEVALATFGSTYRILRQQSRNIGI